MKKSFYEHAYEYNLRIANNQDFIKRVSKYETSCKLVWNLLKLVVVAWNNKNSNLTNLNSTKEKCIKEVCTCTAAPSKFPVQITINKISTIKLTRKYWNRIPLAQSHSK